jgi:regulatory protein
MKPLESLSIKGRALRLLSAREHSRAELERKLAPHAPDAETLSQTLGELSAKGFLRDERVVESVLHQRASRYGTQRVVHELQRKGLSGDLIEAAQTDLQATEVPRAWEVWQRKFGAAPQDAAEKVRQMRFLATRGFSQEAIRRVLDMAKRGESPETGPQ